MAVMATLELPVFPEGLTVEDLARFPDDGRRYELLDGTLLVSAAPLPRHQIVIKRLLRLLDDSCPPEYLALMAPVDVQTGPRTSLQPDVLVFAKDSVVWESPGQPPPLLAVEVLSPSSWGIDLGLKRLAYAPVPDPVPIGPAPARRRSPPPVVALPPSPASP